MEISTLNFESLYKNLTDEMKKEFKAFGVELDDTKKQNNIFIEYANWRNRFICSRPRKIHYSKQILKNPNLKKFKKGINKIKHKIKNGEDLTPFLSKQVALSPCKNNSKQRGMDKDIFLNAFGIYHLHLSNKYEKTAIHGINFVERNSELLFLIVKKNNIYFIDITPHNFANFNLFRIIKDNWEHLIERYEVKDVIDVNIRITEDSIIKDFLKVNMNFSLTIDDKHYMLSSLTTSGYPESWFMQNIHLKKFLRERLNFILLNKNEILKSINQSSSKHYNSLDIQIHLKDGLLYFFEKNSNTSLYLNLEKKELGTYEYLFGKNTHSTSFNSFIEWTNF